MSSKNENIAARVMEAIAAQLELPLEEVRPESSFAEDLKADSLTVMELVLALEDTFDVAASDEEIDWLRTVKDAIKFVEERVGA